jgi:hypothetical protein
MLRIDGKWNMSEIQILTYVVAGSEGDEFWNVSVDEAPMQLNKLPRWRYAARIGFAGGSNLTNTQRRIRLRALSKQYQLPVLAPIEDGAVVTLYHLKALPQTDEVKVLGVKLALLESRLSKVTTQKVMDLGRSTYRRFLP